MINPIKSITTHIHTCSNGEAKSTLPSLHSHPLPPCSNSNQLTILILDIALFLAILWVPIMIHLQFGAGEGGGEDVVVVVGGGGFAIVNTFVIACLVNWGTWLTLFQGKFGWIVGNGGCIADVKGQQQRLVYPSSIQNFPWSWDLFLKV